MRLTHTEDSLKLTEFAEKYSSGWHGFASDKRTGKAVKRALELGRIEVNEFQQFKYKG